MKQFAPLTKSQLGIYIECMNHLNEPYYNLPYIYILDKSLDGTLLCQAVETAVKAHPTLFTRIVQDEDGEPQQTIDMDNEEWTLSIEQIEDINQVKNQLIQQYDILGGRLFHIRLFQDGEHFYLFIDYHHIIVDGTSMSLMLHDIERAYQGENIEKESITLSEIAFMEYEERKKPIFEEAKQWYAKNFDCSDTFTQLIPDKEEPEYAEGSLLRTLSIDMNRVNEFCQNNGIYKSTLFTLAYAYLLAKFTNKNLFSIRFIMVVRQRK